MGVAGGATSLASRFGRRSTAHVPVRSGGLPLDCPKRGSCGTSSADTTIAVQRPELFFICIPIPPALLVEAPVGRIPITERSSVRQRRLLQHASGFSILQRIYQESHLVPGPELVEFPPHSGEHVRTGALDAVVLCTSVG